MVTQTKKPPLTVSNPWWGHDPSKKQLKALWAYEECPDIACEFSGIVRDAFIAEGHGLPHAGAGGMPIRRVRHSVQTVAPRVRGDTSAETIQACDSLLAPARA